MDREVFDVNNIMVQMLMVVHLQQLQISGLSTLAYSDLEQYLSIPTSHPSLSNTNKPTTILFLRHRHA